MADEEKVANELLLPQPSHEHHSPTTEILEAVGRVSMARGSLTHVIETSYARPLSWKTRIGYAFGSIVERTQDTVFMSISMIFFNQVVGLTGTLASLALTIALIVDAVADPSIGSWSDRVKTRFGRRHPFMYLSSIPVALSLGLLFNPPYHISKMAAFFWFTCFTILFRLSVSFYSVPFMGLGAELTSHPQQRSILMSMQALFGYFVAPMIMFIGYQKMLVSGAGLLNRDNYPPFIYLCCAVVFVASILCAVLTHDQIKYLPTSKSHPGIKALIMEFVHALRNRSFISVVIAFLLLSTNLGIADTILLYTGLYFWRLKTTEISGFTLTVPIAAIIGPPITLLLLRKFEKRTLIMLMCLFYAVLGCTPVSLRLLGVLDLSHNVLLFVLYGFMMLTYICLVGHNILVMNMLADIADQHEVLTYKRNEGIFYSARTLIGKSASALGHVFGGIGVDIIGLVPGSDPEHISQKVRDHLGILSMIGSIAGLLAMVSYGFYAIDNKKHQEIVDILKKRAQEQARSVEKDYDKL
eukprot:NODE_1661_length_1859_cov_30.563940_g1408_i0.p1 GENE.NODE_1661_length_1859_cov_30.563940_g1408_i0~~NODE_1661_length_1859_cov_30.563940_g1408_i0.p1  ORF type:complete len:538 (-),score=84.12 NODE_1661_length_1859_cov_30.563940_g1408_i0:244-1821(-)